ncbi:MAG TPA: hypothetical protein PLX69_08900 [Leptospiraceae bacterium]|nr:hypothetical protein [Leptospiraceae bacterium]HRG74662.1 hypothetical protein [Leptospiraceae bacterium]
MRNLLIVFIIAFLFSCKTENQSSLDSESTFLNLGLLFQRSNRLTISGVAVKGIVKNGIVTVSPLNKDGSCNSSRILAMSSTDTSGEYSLVYDKTDGLVCVTVSPNSNRETTLFDEKTNSDIPLTSDSSFKLVTILPESKIVDRSRKNVLASPFSRMLGSRLQSLIKASGENADTTSLYKKASKELVIRFGLSTGLSSTARTFRNTRATQTTISDKDYPELEDIEITLENPQNPLSAKFISILAGFSYLANKTKLGKTTTPDDVEKVISAFASDFEDGIFDGKTADGKSITIGTGANQILFSNSPLTTILLPAIASYIQEGGRIYTGSPNTSSLTISSTQVTNQTQFIDNVPIQNTPTPSAPSPNTPVPVGTPVSNALFTVGGTISGLSISGLVLKNNGSDNLFLTSGSTAFTFTTSISGSYSVTIQSQPPGLFCKITNGSGTATANVTSVGISCGSDGSIWTARTMPGTVFWRSIAYGNGVFVVIAGSGSPTNVSASSTDGITWTARTMPSTSSWTSVTFGNGVFVAIANSSSVAATSPDGITWTARTLSSSTFWTSLTFGNNIFVAVASGTTIAATSPDGITWTPRTLPSSSSWSSVTYGNGVFVAVSDVTGNTLPATSPDGITWTGRTMPAANWYSVTYGNGIFVAVDSNASTNAASSPDGINWTLRTLPTVSTWWGVGFGNGYFVAVGGSGNGATSSDGITWTARTLPIATYYSVAYGNGSFVVAGLNTTVGGSSP